MIQFVSNREIYEQVVRDRVPRARHRLWIATADIKDMYVDAGGSEMVPFLKILAQLVGKGVEIRLIHAKEPGPNFREDFDRYPRLFTRMERVLCPRVHFKCIIIDGTEAWFGSANLTGAGMGAKSDRKRNFENGILTDDSALIAPLAEQFDAVWRGDFCRDCGRKDFCPDPICTDDL
ncbi:MAG: phospholipase D-like domain-containing protein [bacterium]|nr:phospholipase D-like domain-containing protein [bacterium]